MRNDQKEVEKMFEDESLHFTARCSRYNTRDVLVEQAILSEYSDWVRSMRDDAKKIRDLIREPFFEELSEGVYKDRKELSYERDKVVHAENECLRQTLAKKLGIPVNNNEWDEEHVNRFSEYGAYVPGWGSQKDEFERLRVAHELAVPLDNAEWLPDHFRKFLEYEGFVIGWGYSGHERQRQRVALELGIPAFQKEWKGKIGSDYPTMVKM